MHSLEARVRAGSADSHSNELVGENTAFIAWVTLVAPGVALSIGLLLLALLAAPLLPWGIYVETSVRLVAGLLLLAHLTSTLWIVRHPGDWSARTFCLLLIIDAALCGVVLRAPWQVFGVAMPLVGVVVALSLVVAGAPGILCAALAIALGVGATAWHGIGTPLVFLPTRVEARFLATDERFPGVTATDAPSLSTLLLIDPYFAGVLTAQKPDYSFATELMVEPYFSGIPGLGSAAALVPASLTWALLALCSGSALNLLRVWSVAPLDAHRAARVEPSG